MSVIWSYCYYLVVYFGIKTTLYYSLILGILNLCVIISYFFIKVGNGSRWVILGSFFISSNILVSHTLYALVFLLLYLGEFLIDECLLGLIKSFLGVHLFNYFKYIGIVGANYYKVSLSIL